MKVMCSRISKDHQRHCGLRPLPKQENFLPHPLYVQPITQKFSFQLKVLPPNANVQM